MSQLVLNNLATQPSAPAAGKVTLFGLTGDKRLYMLDENGVLTALADMAGPQKNYLLNGGFAFAQRQVLTTLATYSATAARAFAHDQWGITNENASVQIRSVDSVAAVEAGLLARYYAKLAKITSAGKVQYSQCIEGTAAAALRGRIVRLQAKMRFSVAANMTVRLGLLQLTSAGTVDAMPATFVSAHGASGTDPTFGANLALLAPTAAEGGTISGNGVTCVLSSSWVRYSAVFTAPTNFVNLVPVIWSSGQLAANDELNIAEVGLYDGADPVTSWSPPHLADELLQLQRFYFKTFRPLVTPATGVGTNSGEFVWPAITAGATAARSPWFQFPAVMRKVPTMTFFNPGAANALARDEIAAADTGALTALTGPQETGLSVVATGAAGTAAGNHLGLHFTAEAGL